MHKRRNINGQGLVQSELVQMSTFSTDMECFEYEMHTFFFTFFLHPLSLRARAKCLARLAFVKALANNTNKHSRLHVYAT